MRPASTPQSGFAEKFLAVVDEGRRTATYKLALLLALVDGVAEGVDELGETSTALHSRQVARSVARLYWPQLRAFPADRGPIDLRQITNKQATILTALTRARAAVPVRTWDEAEVSRPEDAADALDIVEVTVARYPILRLQTIDGTPSPFIYDVDWNDAVTLTALHRDGGGQVVFRPGAAAQLIRLAPLIRPLVELHWVRMVAQLNRLTPVEDDLRRHLFGADRVAFPVALRNGLRELQRGDCFYCHKPVTTAAAVDHFLPWSRWPNDALENLVLAHDRCNGKKSDHVPGLIPLRSWGRRLGDHGVDLAELAVLTGASFRPARTLAMARSLYGYLTPGAPLWDGPGLVSHVHDPADLLHVLAGLDP